VRDRAARRCLVGYYDFFQPAKDDLQRHQLGALIHRYIRVGTRTREPTRVLFPLHLGQPARSRAAALFQMAGRQTPLCVTSGRSVHMARSRRTVLGCGCAHRFWPADPFRALGTSPVPIVSTPAAAFAGWRPSRALPGGPGRPDADDPPGRGTWGGQPGPGDPLVAALGLVLNYRPCPPTNDRKGRTGGFAGMPRPGKRHPWPWSQPRGQPGGGPAPGPPAGPERGRPDGETASWVRFLCRLQLPSAPGASRRTLLEATPPPPQGLATANRPGPSVPP